MRLAATFFKGFKLGGAAAMSLRFYMQNLPRDIQCSQPEHDITSAWRVTEAIHNVIKHAHASKSRFTWIYINRRFNHLDPRRRCGFQKPLKNLAGHRIEKHPTTSEKTSAAVV